MFRITYSYFKVDENFKPIGDAFVKFVDGETIQEVNNRFAEQRYYNDVTKYTPLNFMDVSEIKEH